MVANGTGWRTYEFLRSQLTTMVIHGARVQTPGVPFFSRGHRTFGGLITMVIASYLQTSTLTSQLGHSEAMITNGEAGVGGHTCQGTLNRL